MPLETLSEDQRACGKKSKCGIYFSKISIAADSYGIWKKFDGLPLEL